MSLTLWCEPELECWHHFLLQTIKRSPKSLLIKLRLGQCLL